MAIELKRRAPNAHTFLEAVRARYGMVTHLVFLTFGLVTNILVTAMLLTGGSAVVQSLTGVPTAAACFLLPIGVVLYTMFGGIKATFLTDYVHTVMILIIIFIFAFTTYATNDILGSPGRVYDALVAAAKAHPVEGNTDGSYLTMHSKEGAIFFVINIVGNFGTVFLDNGYYNKAIAASPVGTSERDGVEVAFANCFRCASRLCYGRSFLVRYSVALRHDYGPCSSCTREQPCLPNIPWTNSVP